MEKGQLLLRRPNGLLLHRTQASAESSWREDQSYKFLFSPAGSIYYQTKDRSYTLQPQQFLVLPPHLPHQQLGYEREKFLIEIPSSFLHGVAQSLGVQNMYEIQFALLEQKHPQLTQWARFTIDTLTHYSDRGGEDLGQSGDALFLDHALVQLVILLLQHAPGSHRNDLSVRHLQQASDPLLKVMEALKMSYTHPWTLEEMAQAANMNKYQFAHLFKEAVGISPYSWLQLYRLIRSQELLIKTEKTILEIALGSGFSSLNVYNQLFKRVYCISPAAFRKRYR